VGGSNDPPVFFPLTNIIFGYWVEEGQRIKFLKLLFGWTTYKILSNILLSRLIPYAEEVIGDHQCGFRRNRSTTDHILCIRQILEKKWE